MTASAANFVDEHTDRLANLLELIKHLAIVRRWSGRAVAGANANATPRRFRTARVGGGPRLSLEEWFSLIQIHHANAGAVIGPSHPDIQSASPVLARLAEVRGSARAGAQLRSPEGLARRLSVLRRIARGDLGRAPRDALTAWRLFEEDPAAAYAIAARTLLHSPTIRLGMPESFPGSDLEDAIMMEPSRGPVPFAGTVSIQRWGTPEWVYLMLLDGPARKPDHEKHMYIKVGRSTDTVRREAELNEGFPPGLGLKWRTIHRLGPFDPSEAHAIEQEVLSHLAAVGLTVGGEFARGDPEYIRGIADAVLADFGADCPLPAPPAPANALSGVERGERNDHVQRT